MKEFVINPLDVLGERRINVLLPNMEIVDVGSAIYRRNYINWINNNLKGRYYIGAITKLINNTIMTLDIVAFEDPRETILFLLGCPYLAKNNIDNF